MVFAASPLVNGQCTIPYSHVYNRCQVQLSLPLSSVKLSHIFLFLCHSDNCTNKTHYTAAVRIVQHCSEGGTMAADIFDIAFSEVLPVGAESPSVLRRYPNTRSVSLSSLEL